ncbi:amino acid permease [Candidatus Endomicrobiellum devescovinae]|uniref:amino acid permease n=1 Tax=Candidatus Endomicrobiellum devescovinae TaxID=3242322 RepID=UPI002827354F|nr:amino acid permease [Endomicrobium sp.]
MEDIKKEHLQKGLKERHVNLIAIGGSVGIGLFLASGNAIAMSGPCLLLSYVIGTFFMYLIMRALGEVTVEYPMAGSFSAYAHKFISPFAGFAIGWSYWFMWIMICMAQITSIGIYCNFWWPNLHQWIPALASLVWLTSMNLFNVKIFGEFEFWFAILKVAIIVAFILAGISIIAFGLGNGWKAIGISNLYKLKGGFVPFGFYGILMAFIFSMFSFIGVEFVGIIAGETKVPKKTIPAAINKVVPSISLLYMGPLFVIMCLYPWLNLQGDGVGESVFVTAFMSLGIKKAALVLNFIVILASLSACSSGIFTNGRMLYNLALNNQAPKFLANLSSSKTPVNAVLFSSFVSLMGVFLNYFMPKTLFMALRNSTTSIALLTWGGIVAVQMYARRSMVSENISNLKYPMPFYPYSNYLIFGALILIFVTLAIDKVTRVSAILCPLWLVFLYAVYKLFVKKNNMKTI